MCFSIGAYNCFWGFFCFCFASYCITSDYGSLINLDFFLICLNCNLMDVKSDFKRDDLKVPGESTKLKSFVMSDEDFIF